MFMNSKGFRCFNPFSANGNKEVFVNNTELSQSARNELSYMKTA